MSEFYLILTLLLGDSGVGKTSFIQRFCTDTFKDTFAATIGIDLQVKMLNIDNRIIALQLWDTVRKKTSIYLFHKFYISYKTSLGWSRKVGFKCFYKKLFDMVCCHIRFRSITKQYFRKSDGVILVYDVTSEVTFRNVRAWMTSVRVC